MAYFRGRKLDAKQLKVPKGYRGVVISSTDRILPKSAQDPAEDEGESEEVPEVMVMEEQSEFEDIMVWGHEALPDDTADPYVKGLEEWIAFAEQVCNCQNSRLAETDRYRFIHIVRTKRLVTGRRDDMGLWSSGKHCKALGKYQDTDARIILTKTLF